MRIAPFHMSLAAALLLGGPAAKGQAQAEPAKVAVFAGGCFWCMEPPFDKIDGVLSTTSGFAGGHVANPSYEQVTAGGTGHREVVEVKYDPARVSYDALLATYWANVDPLDPGGQFCDRGPSYTTAIFPADDEQARLATQSKEKVAAQLGTHVVTDIVPLDRFYPAERKHQDYYRENALPYKYYRWRCGRDARLEALWGEQAGDRVLFLKPGAGVPRH